MGPGGQPMSAAQRRKQRRQRSWWRHEQQSIAAALATFTHHSAQRGQRKARAGAEESELHCTAKVWKTRPPQPELFSLYEEEPGGEKGSLPALQSRRGRKSESRGGPWRNDDSVLVVPLLHTFVPQMVDQLVDVLRLIDTLVPKITSKTSSRSALVPQMAEQLVDEPMPSFDDFELVEEKKRRTRSSRVWSLSRTSGTILAASGAVSVVRRGSTGG